MSPSIEERLAYLEGTVGEQSRGFGEIRQQLVQLAARIDTLDQKFDRRIDAVDRRIDALDQKVSRQFVWLVGIQVTVLVSVIAALVGR